MSETKHIVIANHERMQRAKTAMLTMATHQDQYRHNDQWRRVGDSAWQHGQKVDEVNHFGQQRTASGDVLIIERIDGVEIAHVQVLSIRMAATEQLSVADLNALGYRDRSEFDDDWGRAFAGKVWLMTITHLTPQSSPTAWAQ